MQEAGARQKNRGPFVWTINGRFLAQRVTGVQRYAREIVRAIDALASTNHPLTRNLSLQIVAPPNAEDWPELKAIPIKRAGRMTGHAWEQFELPVLASGGLLSLGNLGPVCVRKQIVCIHDANTRIYPQSYSWSFRAAYRILHPALGRQAARIATVSESAARDIAKFKIAAPEKIFVAYNGHEHAMRWLARHTPATLEAHGPNTIVVLGSLAPHKNIGMLVNLAPKLREHGLKLAIVGNFDSRIFRQKLMTDNINNIDWLGPIDDEALAALLSSSMCLAFPSYVEGFGIPAVEAMAAGTAIVSSDRSSLPEVCGDAALYASPDDPAAWLGHFLSIANSPGLRDELIANGRKQMLLFSWQRSAEIYLKEMAHLAGQASRHKIMPPSSALP